MRRRFGYFVLMAAIVLAYSLTPSAPALAAGSCTLSSITSPTFPTFLPLTTPNNATAPDASTSPGTLVMTCTPANKSGTIHISTNTPTMPGSISLKYEIFQLGSTTTQWTTSTDQAFTETNGSTVTIQYNASILANSAQTSTPPNGSYGPDTTTTFTATYFNGAATLITATDATATVGTQCAFDSSTSTTVNFASPYDPIVTNSATGSDETVTWKAVYTCGSGDSTYKWSFASSNASGAQMNMKSTSSAALLNYYVHDSSGTNFPSGTTQTAASQSTGAGATLLNYNFTFGIPKGQNLAAASFSDTNVVTITP